VGFLDSHRHGMRGIRAGGPLPLSQALHPDKYQGTRPRNEFNFVFQKSYLAKRAVG
jgi:hypothetical protein